ncbi:YbaB/EbfC family nucleoid-associated protein [Asticcacaulis sp. EMRT-3]|uniref:YbaB/EbfC family nucleoid-associated protein n=1 Tax=Asticcacaulis sp. EMRT-3 TaxID=3040349 RepID=UPI0024AF01CA|nr:YbaB/EbfC family nucleoid-associated protein [Asticcacaulis sp. EMRT-3]MDI7776213.1 YbaB/EbfC family nucleoid-associated protein [Asticcacaulis sp. EMRT-3]
MDFQQMMKQAQLVQQKLTDAQARMHDSLVSGASGGGMVRLELKGTGDMVSLNIDDSLMVAGEADVLADLVRAAYADARKKLDDINSELMQEAAGALGPGGGLPNLPKFF